VALISIRPLRRVNAPFAVVTAVFIYHLMYGKRQTKACPMCTAWLDGANGVAHHLAQNLDFAVVAAADVSTLRAHARTRGWDKLRLLSAGNSTFKYDLGSEDREGHQDSTVSVFTRDDGTVRHFYTAHPRMDSHTPNRFWIPSGASVFSESASPLSSTLCTPQAPLRVSIHTMQSKP
jgi:predicted dithiol-disulfide oxidoreductase (DUF899 family)